MEEIVVAMHMHTVYSDGNGTHAQLAEAALKAGLDAILVTDHNIWVQDVEGYVQKGKHRVLVLVGEEVHDQTLEVGKNHLLILGNNRELARYAADPQKLIDQATSADALAFIAHPIERAAGFWGSCLQLGGLVGYRLYRHRTLEPLERVQNPLAIPAQSSLARLYSPPDVLRSLGANAKIMGRINAER